MAGKPHPAIFQTALKTLNSNPGETLMVDDRLETDILGANNLDIKPPAVITGGTSLEEINQMTLSLTSFLNDITALRRTLSEVCIK